MSNCSHPPGHLVTYLLGLARQDAFIPGIGWSALDPGRAVARPRTAIVPRSGAVLISLAVPANPALRGLRLFAQGVDVDPRAAVVHAMNVWPSTVQ